MSAHMQRAELLIEQSRPGQAIPEIRQHLADDPDDPLAHAYLALCLTDTDQLREATQEAEQAIGLAPDFPFAHYALARTLIRRNRLDEARSAACEAIRLEPDLAEFHALLAGIEIERRRWADALQAAERGLEIDAEHTGCANYRALALRQLGRREQAHAAIASALEREPDDALTHANRGWSLLDERRPAQALEHFREALRLDPELEWARQGMIEAMKARYFVYRIMLAYFLWMAKLPAGAQWGVIIGGYVAVRILRSVARANPQWEPVVLPIVVLYLAFAVMTWLAVPLFNLLLRLNRFGRMALSRGEIVASNWVGTCLLAALLCVGGAIALGSLGLLLAALVFGLLAIPLSAVFQCDPGWPRTAMTGYTALLAAAGLLAAFPGELFGWKPPAPLVALSGTALGVFLLGIVGSGWVANALIMARPKH